MSSKCSAGKTYGLLARLLDHFLATAYAVRDEVLVGKLPLRVDVLLSRRETGELPEASRRDLSVLVPLLNRFTLAWGNRSCRWSAVFSSTSTSV